MGIRSGRYHVGEFGGVRAVSKNTGEVVPGLFEVIIVVPPRSEDDDPQYLRSSFFATGGQRGSETATRIRTQLDELQLVEGEMVLLRVVQQVRNGYTNDKALDIARMPEVSFVPAKPRAARPVAAAS